MWLKYVALALVRHILRQLTYVKFTLERTTLCKELTPPLCQPGSQLDFSNIVRNQADDSSKET